MFFHRIGSIRSIKIYIYWFETLLILISWPNLIDVACIWGEGLLNIHLDTYLHQKLGIFKLVVRYNAYFDNHRCTYDFFLTLKTQIQRGLSLK